MGKFIVIEGTDGSGKSTQTRKLTKYLKDRGLSVKQFHFPSGKGFYGRAINAFLRGDLGGAEEVDPYYVAFLFARDRIANADLVRKWIEKYDIVLMDRYAYSNIAYQCAKLMNKPREKEKLYRWIVDTEFAYGEIPIPDLCMVLGVPRAFSEKKLTEARTGGDRDYLEGGSDVHEQNLVLQKNVGSIYREMCSEFDEMVYVECGDPSGKMLTSREIHQKILEVLEKRGII
ncbi:MAG: thymidylate kinase [Firmicutes bacterium]|nr:thymidylate kinase [Bacillota bacterium]